MFLVLLEFLTTSIVIRRKSDQIDINTELIKKSFENATFQGDIYLVNNQNEILYSTEYNEIEYDNRYFSDEYVSTDSLIFSETYHDNYMENWRVIGVVSESVALEEAQNSRLLIFLFASINFIVPSFVIIYITSSLHVRLLRILRKMKKVKNQQFDIIEGVEYKDEIGQLTSEFNRMSKKIKDLINDVYIANLQKKDLELKSKQAQLSALQSQINPHFLFNSLETIRMRSLLKGEKETAHIIKNMAKILRNSISWGREWVRVEEEVKMLEYFLEIQKYRFGHKLEYDIIMDEDVMDCMVPNMAFTPFVENASIHGVEPMLDIGFITVTIKMKGNYIICKVEDNGVGMEEAFLQSYLHSLEEDESMGDRVGIRNVYYRMKLLYGDQFTLTMKSKLGKGTTVEIVCPASHEMKQ